MPDTLFLGNLVKDWLIAVGIAIAAFFIMKTLQRAIVRRVGKFAEKTRTELDDLLVGALRKTRLYFFVVIALYLGAQALTLSPPADRILNAVLVLGTLLQAAIWGNAAIAFFLQRALRQRTEADPGRATTLSALGVVAKIVLWSILILLALDNLGVNITGLIAGLGIGGIAVALALQNILGDLFASLSIALDKPFVIGDFIVVDEFLGTVDHIGLKTTRMRSLSGEEVIFSNTDLLKSRIRNFKRMYERRVVFGIGVTYETPHDRLAGIPAILKRILESHTDVRFDRAHFKEFADSSLNFEVVYFVTTPDYNRYMDIQQSINLEIYRQFHAAGIAFAYPTRTIYVQNPP
ncbi:MAG: mechanosensitive ion channel family protein [Bacteroidota bacterium]